MSRKTINRRDAERVQGDLRPARFPESCGHGGCGCGAPVQRGIVGKLRRGSINAKHQGRGIHNENQKVGRLGGVGDWLRQHDAQRRPLWAGRGPGPGHPCDSRPTSEASRSSTRRKSTVPTSTRNWSARPSHRSATRSPSPPSSASRSMARTGWTAGRSASGGSSRNR